MKNIQRTGLVNDGNAFWDQLDFQANPLGRVIRMDDPNGDCFSPEEWSDLVSLELEKSTPVELAIETDWHPNSESSFTYMENIFLMKFPANIGCLFLSLNLI